MEKEEDVGGGAWRRKYIVEDGENRWWRMEKEEEIKDGKRARGKETEEEIKDDKKSRGKKEKKEEV